MDKQMALSHFFAWTFWIFMGYYLLGLSYHVIFGLMGLTESWRRAREHEEENYAALSDSSFTLPISIIIPAHNEELWIADTVLAVLQLDYPQFELIVVDDGSTDRTLAILTELLNLKAFHNVYTDQFRSGKLLGLFKSQTYPHVSVLSKASGQKKAGAVNAGLNVAKYKYVCNIDCDTILEQDALLKVMAHVQKDPERVVGIGSYFGLANGFNITDGKIIERRFVAAPIAAYQNLEYIRSFIGNRIGWSRLNAMPNVSGGFNVWRRDVLLAAGAFDSQYSSEDLETTLRIHDYLVRHGMQDHKILMLPHYVGWTEGPSTVKQLVTQRNRWQRTINEAVWRYKHMLFNPRYGNLGFITLPYYVLYEVCGVFFEIGSVAVTLLGFLMGFFQWRLLFGFFMFMVLCQALTSLIPIFIFNRDHKLLKNKDIVYFIALSFLELFWYRWVLTWAKLRGWIDFCRGKRTMDIIQRHKT